MLWQNLEDSKKSCNFAAKNIIILNIMYLYLFKI